ncbi:MAG: InlB B-repeat-containing protein, partial [Clostridiales bacterium]|nr:InlB B-repeat-containing protein [Clostridiales bacterium]
METKHRAGHKNLKTLIGLVLVFALLFNHAQLILSAETDVCTHEHNDSCYLTPDNNIYDDDTESDVVYAVDDVEDSYGASQEDDDSENNTDNEDSQEPSSLNETESVEATDEVTDADEEFSQSPALICEHADCVYGEPCLAENNDGLYDDSAEEETNSGELGENLSADENVTDDTGISIFSVPEETYTVRFFAENDDDTPLELRYILSSDNEITEAAPPDLPDGMNAFLGWFSEMPEINTTDEAVSFPCEITQDTDFYAGWSNKFLISFLDYEGNILVTQQVEPGGLAENPENIEYHVIFPDGLIGTGNWLLNGELYDFNTPVTGNIELTPQVSDSLSVQFVTKANAIDPLFVSVGEVIEQPADPVRAGYTFLRWSSEENGEEAFDFNEPITESVTIYAVWQSKSVSYKIVYWIDKNELTLPEMETDEQKNNIKNYNLDRYINATGPAGEEITITSLPVLNNAADLLYYTNIWKSETKTIAGDGSTIINVYCLQKIYNCEFQIPFKAYNNINYNSSDYKYTFYKVDGTTIDFIGGEDLTYTARFKPGNFLADPDSLVPLERGDLPHTLTRISDNTVINLTEQPFVWNMVSASGSAFSNNAFSVLKGITGDTVKIYAAFRSNLKIFHYTVFREVYNNTKPIGEEITDWFLYNGKYYAKAQVVYKAATDTGSFQNVVASNDYQTVTAPTRYWDKTTNAWATTPNNDNTLDWVMLRDYREYPLSLELNGGKINSSMYTLSSASLYKSAVYNYTTPLLFLKPEDSSLSKPNQVFAGWYADSNFLQPFDWENTTMGMKTAVYAKWANVSLNVDFVVSGDVYSSVQVESGKTVDMPDVYTVGENYTNLGRFMGWYYNQNNNMVSFDFNTFINKDTTLYAVFDYTDPLTLTYDIDGGKGLETPVDGNTYYQGSEARSA